MMSVFELIIEAFIGRVLIIGALSCLNVGSRLKLSVSSCEWDEHL